MGKESCGIKLLPRKNVDEIRSILNIYYYAVGILLSLFMIWIVVNRFWFDDSVDFITFQTCLLWAGCAYCATA